ncbi:MAG: hypothetical protein WCL46_00735 [Chlorobium sp.]
MSPSTPASLPPSVINSDASSIGTSRQVAFIFIFPDHWLQSNQPEKYINDPLVEFIDVGVTKLSPAGATMPEPYS